MSNIKSIEETLYSTMKTVLEVQKNAYDRTIQATVVGYQNENDKAIGKLKLKYQDTYIYAFVTDLTTLDSYTKGENVYINIPNNDISQEKTVIGLVKKIGDVSLAELEDRYYTQGESFYKSNSEPIEISSANSVKDIIDTNSQKQELADKINNRKTQNLLIQADFYANIDYNTVALQNYALEIQYTINDVDFFTFGLSLNDFEGDPYKIGQKDSFETQSVIISLENLKDQTIKVVSFQLVGRNLVENDIIKVKNILIQPIILYTQQDNNGLSLKISANKVIFSANALDSETITLKGVLKSVGVLQDLTEFQDCYWYVYDGMTGLDSLNLDGYDSDRGGIGWHCLNNTIEIDNKIEYVGAKNKFIIQKKNFTFPQRKYKLVMDYNGQRVSAEITIQNNRQDYTAEIINNTNSNTYQCVLQKKNSLGVAEDMIDGVTYQWVLNNKVIGAESRIAYPEGSFIGKETLKCNCYIVDPQTKRKAFCIAAEKILSGERKSNGVIIENREQVFLYEGQQCANSPVRQNATFPIALKPLSVSAYKETTSGQERINADFYWLIPNSSNKDTLTLILPYDTSTSAEEEYNNNRDFRSAVDEINNREIVSISLSQWYVSKGATLNFSIAEQYKEHYFDQIYVIAYNEQNNFCEIARTDFSFAQEGEQGTNNSGVYCRIVPNIIDGIYNPPYISLSFVFRNTRWEEKLNFQSNDDNHLFRVQIWKQNQKEFDGFRQSGEITNLSWIPCHTKSKQTLFSISDSQTGKFQILNPNSWQESARDDGFDQWIAATIGYKGLIYKSFLPIFISWEYYTGESKEYRINNGMQTPLTFFYYQEDGEGLSYITQNNVYYTIPSGTPALAFYPSLQSNEYIQGILNNNSIKIQTTQFFQDNVFDSSFVFIGKMSKAPSSISKSNKALYVPACLMLKKAASFSLDSWKNDINKIEIQEDNGDIFAKRFIGGIRDNNQLTGVIDGEHNFSGQTQIGLLTYHAGQETSFINAETGSASFGASALTQIKIDGVNGVIKSRTYDINSKEDVTVQKNGLSINFSEPSLKFANLDNFSITANGEGKIAKWEITQNTISRTLIDEDKEKIGTVGISANADPSTSDLNNQSIKLWGVNKSLKAAMGVWTTDLDDNLSSCMTHSGAFIGRKLIIKGANKDSYSISSEYEIPEQSSLINTLEIGANNGVISLFSKKKGNTELALELNALRFNFGSPKIFNITREGEGVFQNLQISDSANENLNLILSNSSIKCENQNGNFFWLRKDANTNKLTLKETDQTFCEITSNNGVKTSGSFKIKTSIEEDSSLMILNSTSLTFSNNIQISKDGFHIPDICTLRKVGGSYLYSTLNLIGELTVSDTLNAPRGTINGISIGANSHGSSIGRITCEEGLYLTSNTQVILSAASNQGEILCNSNGIHLTGDIEVQNSAESGTGIKNLWVHYKDENGNDKSLRFCNGLLVEIQDGIWNFN